MNRYVEWKRSKLCEKHRRELITFGVCFVALPVVIAVMSWLWRIALASVLG